MMSRSKVIVLSVSIAILYSIILGAFGIFGDTIQSAIIFFLKNILPVIAIVFGYFLIVFVPIRIFQAIERNKEIQKNKEVEQNIQEHSDNEKEIQQKILDLLNNEDTL